MRISGILHRIDAPLDGLLDEVVGCLPEAFQVPAITAVRISLHGRVHATPGFRRTSLRLAEPIIEGGLSTGLIEICLQASPDGTDGSVFLDEEYALVALVAQEVAQISAQRRQADHFRKLLENAPDAMVIVDGSGCITMVNAGTEQLFGYERDELVGQPVEVLIPERLRERHRVHRAAFGRAPEARPMGRGRELVGRCRDGSEIPIEVSLGPLETLEGALVATTIRDVSERRRADAVLQRLHRVRVMMSAVNAMIARANDRDELLRDACRMVVENGGFLMAWAAFVEGEGVRPAASYGEDRGYVANLDIRLDPRHPHGQGPVGRAVREARSYVVNEITDDPAMQPWREAALERGYRAIAAVPMVREGRALGTLNFYSAEGGVFDADEVALLEELAGDVAFAIDAIEQRRRVDYLALHDTVTHLANRTLFAERLNRVLETAREGAHQVALLVLDMERFKAINDALGMAAGDAVLREVAERLSALAGAHDRVARLEGDRFAMLVPRIRGASDLSALVEEEIWEKLGAPMIQQEVELRPAVRSGIAIYPDDGVDAEALFRNAEAALKEAKSSNEHYAFYARSMNHAVHQRLALEGRLRHAMDADQLRLYYQPKLALSDGRICGAEALLRWPKVDLELRIGEVIQLIEDIGAIHEVGHWALQRAIADRQRWKEAGLVAPPVAVNVSGLQLQHPRFVEDIASLSPGPGHFRDAGIELELTESTLLRDVTATQDKLQQLAVLGLRVAIDDFGTGYSSLSYLSRLPLHALKIDRSFITELGVSTVAGNIVQAIISLAHSMQLRVIAEGVETPEQFRLLRQLGCDEIQGWLFSKAVPPDDFAELLRRGVSLSPKGAVQSAE
jgi:diguanylate cyclase (GGDEF)-like protein/PAS domain S-box-containing protein